MQEQFAMILDRLESVESDIEQIAAFLRKKASTLGETFPVQQQRKAVEAVEAYRPEPKPEPEPEPKSELKPE